eukprot:gene22740-biopygen16276
MFLSCDGMGDTGRHRTGSNVPAEEARGGGGGGGAAGERENARAGRRRQVFAEGEQDTGAGVARAWRGRGAGCGLQFGMSGAGVARAWRGHGAGMSCSPRDGKEPASSRCPQAHRVHMAHRGVSGLGTSRRAGVLPSQPGREWDRCAEHAVGPGLDMRWHAGKASITLALPGNHPGEAAPRAPLERKRNTQLTIVKTRLRNLCHDTSLLLLCSAVPLKDAAPAAENDTECLQVRGRFGDTGDGVCTFSSLPPAGLHTVLGLGGIPLK